MSEIVIGIDASLTNTAVCHGYHQNQNTVYGIGCFGSDPNGKTVIDRISRYDTLAMRIASHVRHAAGDRHFSVWIEDYAFSQNKAHATRLREFGGILRLKLMAISGGANPIYEVAPSTLKKFVAAKQKGGKTPVIAQVTHRYGVVFETDDEYDAFVLMQIGLLARGFVRAQNQKQLECVQTVLNSTRGKKK